MESQFPHVSEPTKIRLYELGKDPKEWFKDVPPDSIETIILYHGTTSLRFESISDQGLKPRKETGISTYELENGGRAESQPDRIYLGSRYMAKRLACKESIYRHAYHEKVDFSKIKDGQVFVLLFEVEVDTDNLVPDEDSYQKTWHESLKTNRTCAYKGNIPKKRIRKIWKSQDPFEHDELIYDATIEQKIYLTLPKI